MIVRLSLLFALTAGPALADGAATFQAKCGACHSVSGASGPVAPGLKGVVGRKIASRTDFHYSAALKAKSGAWTPAKLDAFLTAPNAFAPGTRMLAGPLAPADRAAIVGYLKTLR